MLQHMPNEHLCISQEQQRASLLQLVSGAVCYIGKDSLGMFSPSNNQYL